MTDHYANLREGLESLRITTGELRGPEAQVAALLADYDRLRNALELFLAHSPEPECAIWRHVHDTARAALAQDGS